MNQHCKATPCMQEWLPSPGAGRSGTGYRCHGHSGILPTPELQPTRYLQLGCTEQQGNPLQAWSHHPVHVRAATTSEEQP